MRLTADQVKEAVLHKDQDVREGAVYYFARSYSPDPSIMPLAIQAIEQHGWRDAFETYSFVQDLVHTDESVLWLVGQIRQSGNSNTDEEPRFRNAIRSALIHIDPVLLQRHDSQILELEDLDEKAKDAICQRIRFLSQSPEELWFQLEEFCQRSDNLNEVPGDLDLAYHVTEALGRHPEFSVHKVLPILNGETGDAGRWIEIFAVGLAGELKLHTAITQIVRLLEDADDWIFEDAQRTLVKIGGDDVVRELAEQYPNGDVGLRISAASILEEIHSDLSVETGLRLFGFESDHIVRCSLLQSVLMNFSTEGIEPARQFILETPPDPEVLEVRTALVTTCKMLVESFPEFDAWQEDAKNDMEFRKEWYRKLAFSEDDFEDDFDEPVAPPKTIVRQHERIGRNDPCPCGSGKKYKNCCLRNQKPDSEADDPDRATTAGGAQKKPQYPIGTVAFYGPDDKVTTKIVAAVFRRPGAEPVLERWVGTNIAGSPKVQRQIRDFLARHGAKSVAATDRNMGCPHEEGEDFPLGEDCPFCPYWVGKQGSNRPE